MTSWRCARCRAQVAPGAPRCPECPSTQFETDTEADMTLKIARDGSVSDSADAGRDASRSPGEPSPGTSADASLAAESDVSPAELAAPAGAGAGQVPEDVQAPDAAPEPAPAPKVPPRTPPRRPPAVPRE